MKAFVESTTFVCGYFPAHIFSLGEAIPKNVAREWTRWSMQSDYLFSEKFKLDTSRYSLLSIPHRVYIIEKDPLAPEPSVRALAQRYPNNSQEIKVISSRELDVETFGHNDFFKEVSRPNLWPDLCHWIENQIRTSS